MWWNIRNPELSLAGWALMPHAKTLRELVFCRVLDSLGSDTITFKTDLIRAYQVHPPGPTLPQLIEACQSSMYAGRDALGVLPHTTGPATSSRDPELKPWLQDLADILAHEATAAFLEDYYLGVDGIEPVSDEHVSVVMGALQREMDREGASRHRRPARFVDLPPQRQRALAERRRLWYGKFGITQANWASGTFSLWDVAEEPIPELVKLPRPEPTSPPPMPFI